jgi:F-type H+-transporting ATPase subunit delta
MQGASRDALASAWARVETLLAGAPNTRAALVSHELFGVVGVLDEQPALRRALSDPAVSAARKTELADAVFASRLDATTLEAVRSLVRDRWSRTRDLVDSLEELAVLARLIGAAADGLADEVEDELFRFGRIVESRPELHDALSNRNLPIDNKLSLVSALLDGKASGATVELVRQAVAHPRTRTPEEVLGEYGAIAARRRQRFVARVLVAVPMTDDERSRLGDALARLYGHDVHLQVEVDPQIVGGVVVHIGDDVIDGSIIGRLSRARQQLK